MYQLYNCAEFVFLYLAPQKIGAINCPINFRLSYGETAYAIDDSKPKIYFYDAAVVKLYTDRLAEPDDFVAQDNTEIGEIIVKPTGKCAFDYINKPEEAKSKFYKGWLYIGDLGTWNDEEFITVVGRKDDMIISGAENIQPVQVEEILNQCPKVRENVVVGMPDDIWGQVVVAYVVKEDPTLTHQELEDFCLNHPMLARYKRPRYYRFVDALPLTATGKKMHYKVKQLAVEDSAKGLLLPV